MSMVMEVPYDLTYYMFVDSENFMAFYEGHYAEAWWLPGVEEWVESLGTYGAWQGDAVFILGPPDILTRRYLTFLVAHEHFHAFQVPRHGSSLFWLIEGSAMHAGTLALEYFGYPLDGNVSYFSRQAELSFARGFDIPLEYMEEYHQFYELENLRAGYAVAALAVEYLVDHYGGFEAVVEYYRDPSRDFHAAFGISLEDFYVEFAEYRRITVDGF